MKNEIIDITLESLKRNLFYYRVFKHQVFVRIVNEKIRTLKRLRGSYTSTDVK